MRVLIVDDEPLACRNLRLLIEHEPHLTCVGEVNSLEQTEARLTVPDYDLVLLDLQLRGANGFDLVPLVRAGAQVIFVTACHEQALRALEVNSLDYVVRPVTSERFAAALSRLSSRVPRPASPPPLSPADSVLVETGTGARLLPVADISAIFSHDRCSDVLLRCGQRLSTRRTLKAWEEMLPGEQFARVHRQALLNLTCVEDIGRDSGSTALLHVTGAAEPVDVSRRHVPDMEARLGARLRS